MIARTTAQERFWLDEAADCPVPPGWFPVEDEVTFLGRVGLEEPLFVRGGDLCRWARGIAQARGWPVRSLESPVRALVERYPELDPEAAQTVVDRLGDRIWSLSSPLRAADVLSALRGESLWQGAPSASHAARWLIWWVTERPEGVDRALAIASGTQWAAEVADTFLECCYATKDIADAEARLEEWLGLLPDGPVRTWPGVELPAEVEDRLLRRMKLRLAEGGLSREPTADERLWPPLQEPTSRIIAAYLAEHPSQLSERWLAWLGRFLSQGDLVPLWRLRRPDEPNDPPSDANEVITWYRERYLPWRTWAATSRDSAALQRAIEIGRAFGKWYLTALPQLLAGAQGQECLAWVRALRLKDDTELVTLLVVADGLAPHDIDGLLHHLRSRVPFLRVVASEWAYAQLPTVTEFTKPAIVSQELTGRSVEEHGGSSSYRVTPVVDLLCNANPGDVVAWVLAEPDRAYHFTHDQSELASAVDERLYGIAGHLKTIMERIPLEVTLRVVVTADHGRLLGDARRALAVPEGLQSHGRAAWGKVGRASQGSAAYRIEGDLAWLQAGPYGLPPGAAYAVILDHQAFVTADGKGGLERFPHGGLFPEEVLVPWIVLHRHVRVEPVMATLTGEGIVGQTGTLALTVVNPNGFAVKLIQMSVTPGGTRGHPILIPLNETVGAVSTERVTRPLAPWPDNKPGELALVTVHYRLPDGGMGEAHTSADLMSKALYRQDDILGDLP